MLAAAGKRMEDPPHNTAHTTHGVTDRLATNEPAMLHDAPLRTFDRGFCHRKLGS